MYQVRITDSDGTNPVVLEKADNISYSKVINTANEGISFDLPTSDSKTSLIDSTKLWEFWDVIANERLNRGPVHSINVGNDGVTKIAGPGRSQFLTDHIETQLTTFYAPVRTLLDDMRYENVAAGPSTKTYVWDGKAATKSIFFDGATVDEEQYMKYYGLSKQTKDNAIDDNNGYILPGAEEPSNTFFTTNSYWAGTNVYDTLVVDLGMAMDISKAAILFPWWGGVTRERNRAYKYQFSYSDYVGEFDGITSGDWITIRTDTDGRTTTNANSGGIKFYFGATPAAYDPIELGYLMDGPLTTRYFRIKITATRAWYQHIFDDGDSLTDKWGHECDPDSSDDLSAPKTSNRYPKMKDKVISDRVLEPQNDCYAGIVEFYAYTTIVERDDITSLVKQRIKSDNRQIEYFHTPDSSETSTSAGYRVFEPGMFFRHARVTFNGAGSSYTKFFDSDCTNCYSSFNFGIMDDYNSLIYHSTNSSGSNVSVNTPRNVKSITMKGSSDAVVTSVDAWIGKLDPLSWGGSYAYTTINGDYAQVEFRGASFQWWATIPATETGATVHMDIRQVDNNTGNWSGWTVLETGYQLPNNVTSELVYEIPYGTLDVDTTYQIYIENIDGGYLSVDSFGGWWMGSLTDYNEDTNRAYLKHSHYWKQIYDQRFTNGSMLKINNLNSPMYFSFTGDRVQVYSAKGRYHGQITVVLNGHAVGAFDFPIDGSRVFIPGGDTGDGTYTVDLNTGKKGHEVPATLIFDSNNFQGYKFGQGGALFDHLPWGAYTLGIANIHSGTYLTDVFAEDSDQFVARCSDCNPETNGTDEINRFIYVDGIAVHERAAISSNWHLETHSDIIASLAEALELEWNVTEAGLLVSPRVGIDSDIILQEGINTVISTEIVKDGQKMATQLISSGADIDGLPLFTIVENRVNKQQMTRTVQRIQDYRDIADYFTLVGVSRAELVRRREPEYRITAEHIGYKYGLNAGDSFIVKKRTENPIRARINSLIITQSRNSGIQYSLECVKWPPIV